MFPALRFDIADLPEHRRLDGLISAIDECFYPCETLMSSRVLTDDRLTVVDVGPIRAGRVRADPMVVHRTPRLIRRRVGDYLFVPVPLQHKVHLRQRGREAEIDGSCFGFTATAESYSYEQPEKFEMLTLRIDADQVRSRVPHVEDLTATGFPALGGAGAMFLDYARSFCVNAERLDRPTGMFAVRHLLDLFALAVTSGDHVPGPAESAVREAHRQRILRHVEAHLADPSLSTQSVAQDLRLSDRYIQKLLSEREQTLSGLIRDRRVAEARRLLVDPTNRGRSISTIAFQVGYADPAYFSRVFREAVGISPRDYRNRERSRPDTDAAGQQPRRRSGLPALPPPGGES